MIRRGLLALLTCVPLLAQQTEKPYVLLISLDGFRYDYAERFEAKNLLALGRRGVAAKALLPAFPSTTFPNHYTIVTGLYPAHHGIVENSFWDPALQQSFKFSDAKLNSDPRMWGGTPLWVLAEKQGVRSAAYFWPGSDVDVQGTRPGIYHNYDGQVTNEARVAEVISWMRLPMEKRPQMMMLYFSDVDHEGHSFGPDAPQLKAAVQALDKCLGDLVAGFDEAGVKVNIVVVSDHGMVKLEDRIDLAKLADFSGVRISSSETDFKIYSDDEAKLDAVYNALKKTPDDRFSVYRQAEIPARLHYTGNARIGDVVVLADKPFGLTVSDPNRPPRNGNGGGQRFTHGFDVSQVPEMKGIFYAAGPNIKQGPPIEEFENIHIYPWIARILGLHITDKIDGDIKVLAPVLK